MTDNHKANITDSYEVGDICEGKWLDGQYYTIIIDEIIDSVDYFVKFVDFGSYSKLNRDYIKQKENVFFFLFFSFFFLLLIF